MEKKREIRHELYLEANTGCADDCRKLASLIPPLVAWAKRKGYTHKEGLKFLREDKLKLAKHNATVRREEREERERATFEGDVEITEDARILIGSKLWNATVEDADFIEVYDDVDSKTLILKPKKIGYIA